VSAFYSYTLNIEHISGQDTLVSVTINGTVYPAPVPFVMSAVNAPAIVAWLNTAISEYLWFYQYSTDYPTGLSYLNIFTACTSESAQDAITAQVVVSGAAENVAAIVVNCGQTPCAGITATISGALGVDCTEGQQAIVFTDTTGAYSLANPGGYGTPNFPAVSDILTYTFTLLNSTGSVVGTPYTATYVPSATAPFASISLTPANFGITSFTGNIGYQLKYTIVTNNAITCSPLQIPFTMPCCGGVLTSGLAVSFNLQQQPITPANPTPTPVQLTFTDTTYAYATPDNTGGYGTPNPPYSAVSHTEFVVTRPDGQVISFDVGYVPSATNNVAIITAANLGYAANGPIPDGVYKFVFNVYATPSSSECLLASTTIYTVLFQNTYNCLYNQGISLLSGCELRAKERWSTNWNELQMIIAASVGNINCVVGKVERLLEICQLNCPTC